MVEFLTICNWKTQRSEPLVAQNSAKEVERSTQEAISSREEARRMEALIELRGVGVPTASALLHFAYPESYPILDVRALESLGCKGRSQYSVSFWVQYVETCRRLARQYGVTVRLLDKALWQHSKER